MELLQTAFAAGELAPSLHGRVDIAKYATGLKTCKNFIVQAHGGVTNRPGTVFLGPVKDHSKRVRLIPFEFSTTQTYCLEFGDLYMRVIKDGGHVLEPAKTITGATQANPVVITAVAHGYANGDEAYIDSVVGMTELNSKRYTVANKTANTYELSGIDGTSYTAYTSGGSCYRVFTLVTTYTEAELPLLKYVQSADIMTLNHTSHAPAELSRTDHHVWSLDDIDFSPLQASPTSVVVTPQTYKAITGATQANPVVVTAVAHGFSDDDKIWTTDIVGMTELNGRQFTVANKTVDTFELSGEDGTGHTAYSSGGRVDAELYRYKVTAVAQETLEESLTASGESAAAALSTTDYIDTTWTAPAGDIEKYYIYREHNGTYGYIGSVDGTATLTFKDNNIDPELTDTPPKARNPFESSNHPAVATYFEQRRVFAGSDADPQKMWLSQSGRYANMNISTPLKDDDSITFTLNARQVNEIRHLIPLEDMIVLTSGGEWKAGSGQEAFTVSTMRVRPQGEIGCSNVPPIVIGRSILFVQSRGSTVRDLEFNEFESKGQDLSVLSNHLFSGYQISEWAYAQIPYLTIWCVRDDGVMLGLTYMKEHEVWGWHRHETDGAFESVCSIAEGDEDAVYVVVNRTIGGQTKRYIERFHTRRIDYIEDAYFVDCGLTYDAPVTVTGATNADPVVLTAVAHGFANGNKVRSTHIEGMEDSNGVSILNREYFVIANKTADTFELTTDGSTTVDGTSATAYVSGGEVRKAVTTISGLDHLEGKTVAILADGSVQPQRTVANGSITLQHAATEIHVGLPFVSDIETLDIANPQGSIMGKKKKVSSITLKLEKSRGGWAGTSLEGLTEFKQREDEDYDHPINTITGNESVTLDPNWNDSGSIFVRQVDPLPITILTAAPEVIIGD